MKCKLNTVILFSLILLLTGCSQEGEEGEPASKEEKLQRSLDQINRLLENESASTFRDPERLKEMKAGLEEALGIEPQQPAKKEEQPAKEE